MAVRTLPKWTPCRANHALSLEPQRKFLQRTCLQLQSWAPPGINSNPYPLSPLDAFVEDIDTDVCLQHLDARPPVGLLASTRTWGKPELM